jgi:hypothetical protein
MTEKRGSWHLLTGGILGVVLGIILSLWIIPVRYVDTDPSTLREKDRQTYRALIARAYLAEGDINRALARLRLLQESDPADIIVSQAQSMLAKGQSESDARALALLAAAVNAPSLAVTPLPPMTPVTGQTSQPLITTESPSTTGTLEVTAATRTPRPTSTPRPTFTPMATSGPPFMIDGEPVVNCDPLPAKPLLQITVLDASNQPVPGVKIEISQTGGGLETFYTGLFPEINSGYADYEMTPGMTYSIRVGETGQPISNLFAPACETQNENGERVYGNLELTFIQP